MRIFVDTQEEKQKLLEASKHIHDANIDTSIEMVNEIAHLYLSPDQIEVEGSDPMEVSLDTIDLGELSYEQAMQAIRQWKSKLKG